jgi:hypothetical protein
MVVGTHKQHRNGIYEMNWELPLHMQILELARSALREDMADGERSCLQKMILAYEAGEAVHVMQVFNANIPLFLLSHKADKEEDADRVLSKEDLHALQKSAERRRYCGTCNAEFPKSMHIRLDVDGVSVDLEVNAYSSGRMVTDVLAAKE